VIALVTKDSFHVSEAMSGFEAGTAFGSWPSLQSGHDLP
jgi:hypothetical protein